MRRIYLHLGADKCGSSSIQSYLSQASTLRCGWTRGRIRYISVQNDGFLLGNAQRLLAITRPSGYVNSLSYAGIASLSEESIQAMQSQISHVAEDLILSNEGWFRSPPAFFRTLSELLLVPPSSHPFHAIAFVRPPVAWVNSAWWQWGAWKDGVDFNNWVTHATKSTQWANFGQRLQQCSEFCKITIEPIQSNVVRQLCNNLGVRVARGGGGRTNTSLPAAALKLYQSYRHLRPGEHASRNDYIIMHAIKNSSYPYGRVPWVLGRDQVSLILEATAASTQMLLALVSEESRQIILDDPRWWSADAYPVEEAVDPIELPSDNVSSYFHLAKDLTSYLSRRIQFMSILHRLGSLEPGILVKTNQLSEELAPFDSLRVPEACHSLRIAAEALDCISEVHRSSRFGLRRFWV